MCDTKLVTMIHDLKRWLVTPESPIKLQLSVAFFWCCLMPVLSLFCLLSVFMMNHSSMNDAHVFRYPIHDFMKLSKVIKLYISLPYQYQPTPPPSVHYCVDFCERNCK